jgi:L-rhamnose mutarotase
VLFISHRLDEVFALADITVFRDGRRVDTRAGWHNYSLFLGRDGVLFGYVETPDGLDAARAAMDAEPVNARWQAEMAPFFEGAGVPADQMMLELEEVFHLD